MCRSLITGKNFIYLLKFQNNEKTQKKMKKFINPSILYVPIALLLFTIQSCSKNYDFGFNKISSNVSYSPNVITPIGYANLTLSNLIQENTDSVVFGADKSIKLVLRKSPIYHYQSNQIFTFAAQPTIQQQFPIIKGSITVDTVFSFGVDQSERLRGMDLAYGMFNYSISCPVAFTITISFPSIINKSTNTPVQKVINVLAGAGANGSIDISNTIADLSTRKYQDYNLLPVSFSISSTSAIPGLANFNFQLTNLNYNYVRGYFLGQTRVHRSLDSISLGIPFFNNIAGGLSFTNPSITLNITNSVGIPVQFDSIVIVGKSAFGAKANLGISTFTMPVPTFAQVIAGQPVIQAQVYNNTNTNIVSFMALPPTTIYYSGSFMTNPNGDQGQDNYIQNQSVIDVGLDVEVPIQLKTSNLVIQDTMPVSLGSNFSDVKSGSLYLKMTNGFPLNMAVKLIPLDKNSGKALDTISVNLLNAAPVDPNTHIVNGITKSVAAITLTTKNLQQLQNSDKIIFKATLSTYQSSDVKIYSDYYINIEVAIKAGFQTNL